MLPFNNSWYILVFGAIFGTNFVDFKPPDDALSPSLYYQQNKNDDSSYEHIDEQCSRDPDYIVINHTLTSALQQYSTHESDNYDSDKTLKQNILIFATTLMFIISLLQMFRNKRLFSISNICLGMILFEQLQEFDKFNDIVVEFVNNILVHPFVANFYWLILLVSLLTNVALYLKLKRTSSAASIPIPINSTASSCKTPPKDFAKRQQLLSTIMSSRTSTPITPRDLFSKIYSKTLKSPMDSLNENVCSQTFVKDDSDYKNFVEDLIDGNFNIETVNVSESLNLHKSSESIDFPDEIDFVRKDHHISHASLITQPSTVNGPVEESYIVQDITVKTRTSSILNSDSEESFATTSRATSKHSVASDFSVLNHQNPLRILQPQHRIPHSELFKNQIRELESRKMPTYEEDEGQFGDDLKDDSISLVGSAEADISEEFGVLLNYHLFEDQLNSSHDEID